MDAYLRFQNRTRVQRYIKNPENRHVSGLFLLFLILLTIYANCQKQKKGEKLSIVGVVS